MSGGVRQLSSKEVEEVCYRLWMLGGSLKGIGTLFEQQEMHSYYEKDELFGIGQLLKCLSREMSHLELILQGASDENN